MTPETEEIKLVPTAEKHADTVRVEKTERMQLLREFDRLSSGYSKEMESWAKELYACEDALGSLPVVSYLKHDINRTVLHKWHSQWEADLREIVQALENCIEKQKQGRQEITQERPQEFKDETNRKLMRCRTWVETEHVDQFTLGDKVSVRWGGTSCSPRYQGTIRGLKKDKICVHFNDGDKKTFSVEEFARRGPQKVGEGSNSVTNCDCASFVKE